MKKRSKRQEARSKKQSVFFCLFLASCILLPLSVFPQTSASVGTPTRAIQDLDDKMDDYRTGPSLTPADEEFNGNLKRDILHGIFDIRELCKIALGKHWDERSPKEQDDFVQLMIDLLENRAILSKEQGQKKAKTQNLYVITYKGDKYLNPEKARALTRTSVFVKSEDIRVEIDYKLKKGDTGWKIYDVIVDEASLGDNYKFQFDSIIKKHGYPDLVKRMQNKLESIKKKRA